jgi:hypothetical protein
MRCENGMYKNYHRVRRGAFWVFHQGLIDPGKKPDPELESRRDRPDEPPQPNPALQVVGPG